MEKISVYLGAHSIERIDERLLKTGMDIEKILGSLNSYMNKATMYDHPTQYGKKILEFPGINFIFVIANDTGRYEALTAQHALINNGRQKNSREVEISYLTKG